MLRLLTDENVDQDILRGLTRRIAQLDVLSVRDVGLASQPDRVILDWAAKELRAVLTHDIKTMVPDAERRVAEGQAMAGVIFIPNGLAIGLAITDLVLVVECYTQSEMRDRIEYLPL
jgi:Domain of unknown function (DUF5615)